MKEKIMMDKKYEASLHEDQIQKEWESQKTFSADKHSVKPLFSIDTPPPTISGALHIGHIFSYTQTDIIARFKRLSGYNVFYPFGFDDNGLATERFVEKKNKVSGHALGRKAFIDLCLRESGICKQSFEQLWKRMGISADWSKTYSTISPEAQKISQESFLDLYQKGFIYRKEDPALYCTTCRTAVAQAELDDIELASLFNDIVFSLPDGTELLIGTTRPELLPSCVALLFHPEDDRYNHLAGKTAIVPLFKHEVTLIADVLVEKDKGTGLVMCCTFGDKTDITWYKKHNLLYRQSIGLDGIWKETTGILAGLKATQAREKVLAELKEQNLLRSQRPITHTVNVHERCKKEIEYVVLSQWFLNIIDHKQELLTALDRITWHPHFMKSRCKDWIQNLQWDWCLSRQRFYGIPFPVWHCTHCKAITVAAKEDLPLDPQAQLFTKDCTSCNQQTLAPDTDVMDTWNTSSLTPYICKQLFTDNDPFTLSDHAKPFLPMSMRPQAHDIIRTWAFYTIIKTLFHEKVMPWNDIVISGHVLSKDHDKISKSQGNTPADPENLLKIYPADVLRFWTASGTLGHDISFSETQLKIGQKLVTKLWNAFKFIEEHTYQKTTYAEKPESLGSLNEWLLHRASETFDLYAKHFAQYEFSLALNAVETFFWQDLCDNYLEIVKDQFFKPEQYTESEVAATRWTLYTTGLRVIQLFCPFIPFITETIYKHLYQQDIKKDMLSITDFATIQQPQVFEESKNAISLLLGIIASVRKLKTSQTLSLKTPLETITLYGVTKENLHALVPQEALLKGVTQAHIIVYETGTIEQNALEKQGDAWIIKTMINETNKL